MPTAYPYVRVSSSEQAKHGYSLDNQRACLTRYFEFRLKEQGFTLGACFEDRAISGARPLRSRPQGNKLNSTLQAGDVVLIVRTDRAFRNAADALLCMELWQKRGICFHCAENGMTTEDPTGRMCIAMMAVGAAWENEVRAQRVREVKAHRLRMGFWPYPQAPFGFRRVRVKGGWKLTPDPAQREMARQFIAWRAEGWSSMDIWRHLLEQRIAPVGRVGAWSPSAILNYIKRERRLQEAEAKGIEPYGPYLRQGD
jgi:site-specific DNA recombinase